MLKMETTELHNVPDRLEDFLVGENDFKTSSDSDSMKWLPDFKKQCTHDLVNNSMMNLKKLMNDYIKNMMQCVKECYSRPNRAGRVRQELTNTIMIFHYAYMELKVPIEHFLYLEKMSDLMAMYMDMEIKASRKGTECVRKVASRITSSLHLYLGCSVEHILDAVLKTKLITRYYSELCDLVFRWVLRDIPNSSIDIITYTRYILVFKLWRNVIEEKEAKERVTELACRRLQPPSGFIEEVDRNQFLRVIFPKIPKSESFQKENVNSVTTFLMKAKFSARDKAKAFFNGIVDPMFMASISAPNSSNVSSIFCSKEKEKTRVNQILNDIWIGLQTQNSFETGKMHISMQRNERSKYKNSLNANFSFKSESREENIGQNVTLGEDDSNEISHEGDQVEQESHLSENRNSIYEVNLSLQGESERKHEDSNEIHSLDVDSVIQKLEAPCLQIQSHSSRSRSTNLTVTSKSKESNTSNRSYKTILALHKPVNDKKRKLSKNEQSSCNKTTVPNTLSHDSLAQEVTSLKTKTNEKERLDSKVDKELDSSECGIKSDIDALIGSANENLYDFIGDLKEGYKDDDGECSSSSPEKKRKSSSHVKRSKDDPSEIPSMVQEELQIKIKNQHNSFFAFTSKSNSNFYIQNLDSNFCCNSFLQERSVPDEAEPSLQSKPGKIIKFKTPAELKDFHAVNEPADLLKIDTQSYSSKIDVKDKQNYYKKNFIEKYIYKDKESWKN